MPGDEEHSTTPARDSLGVATSAERWSDRLAESYDRVAERYVEHRIASLDRKPFERDVLDRYAEVVRGTGLVCDAGCGPGVIAEYLHARGVDVFGIDISPRMIEVARRRCPGIEFRRGDLRASDVPPASLAGVVSFFSILHLPRTLVPQALDEIARVLRAGGEALFAFYEGEGEQHDDLMLEQPVSVDTTFFGRGEVELLIEAAAFDLLSTEAHAPARLDFPRPSVYVRAARSPGTGGDSTERV